MTCDEVKKLLPDYLFGELRTEQRASVEAHLRQCSACAKEAQTLRETVTALRKWEDISASRRLVFVEASREKRTLPAKIRSFFASSNPVRWAAVAAFLLLLLYGFSRSEISYQNGHWRFAFGPQPEARPNPSAQVLAALRDSQTQTLKTVATLLEENARRQQQNLLLALDHLNQQWQQQRQNDLRFMAMGFQTVKLENENRLQQTNRLVEWLLRQQETTQPIPLQKVQRRQK